MTTELQAYYIRTMSVFDILGNLLLDLVVHWELNTLSEWFSNAVSHPIHQYKYYDQTNKRCVSHQ